MRIVSKKKAMAIKKLFDHAEIHNYCTGKYLWHGKEKHYIGMRAPVIFPGLLAVYIVRRQDKEGVYAKLMCIVDKELELDHEKDNHESRILQNRNDQVRLRDCIDSDCDVNNGLQLGLEKLKAVYNGLKGEKEKMEVRIKNDYPATDEE